MTGRPTPRAELGGSGARGSEIGGSGVDGSEVGSSAFHDAGVRDAEVHDAGVRAEAGRLARRLEVARTRLDDDEVSALLAPALARVTRLHDIARSLSDGTTSDAAAARAVRDVADTQPTRRPR
ncbi:hypothetical protein [Dietzia cercidiphylli]|uniref:hypothetical protein n=1 Tax=Dietzia cercidiphylli TaxID=498199 RepID=UPI00223B75F5|nr:hypothetical protein [Dietzia cercidiphylli]MCT1515652.1 hypothetical protein [Dietzia cercidiphylli]